MSYKGIKKWLFDNYISLLKNASDGTRAVAKVEVSVVFVKRNGKWYAQQPTHAGELWDEKSIAKYNPDVEIKQP